MQTRQKVLNLLGLAMRAGKLVSGTETTIAEIKQNKIKMVFLASDIMPNTAEKVTRACRQARLLLVESFTGNELAHAIGKKRKVIGVTDNGFSKSLTKLINEGV